MSEHATLSESPYKEAFAQIEALGECCPGEAYQRYRQFLEERLLDPSVYFSMAITSGGFARDEDLAFGEAMDRNGDFGTEAAQQLCRQMPEHIDITDIVVPSDLGKVPGWNQGHYLVFWSHVIAGLDPSEAAQIDERLEAEDLTQAVGFVDREASRDQKWHDIKAVVDRYVQLLEELELGKGREGAALPRNMQAIILILDASQSLGVNGERYLAHQLGLGERGFQVVNPTESYSNSSKTLRQLGATVLPAVEGTPNWHIFGRQHDSRFQELRNNGFGFRKGGLLGGVVFRKLEESMPTYVEPTPKTNQEAWAEYFAHQ